MTGKPLRYMGSRRLFSGKLLAIIAAKDVPGEINVKITSPSAEGDEITLTAVPAEVPEGISCIEENTDTGADIPDRDNDIPVRRIEMTGESRTFTPERRTMRFTKTLYPANASYKDIEYRITSVNGIESRLAKITETDENGVTVVTGFLTNLGDRSLRVWNAPELYKIIKEVDDRLQAEKAKELPKYVYPDNVITSPMVAKWGKYGVDYKLYKDESVQISALDAQKEVGKAIYGSGYLVSERAAAERAAAERAAAERAAAERAAAERAAAERAAAIKWQLSERELKIIEGLGKGGRHEEKRLEAEDQDGLPKRGNV